MAATSRKQSRTGRSPNAGGGQKSVVVTAKKSQNRNVLTIRVGPEFRKCLNVALATEGTKLQTKAVELLENYVESIERSATEHDRRMGIAREQLTRYRRTFQELAK